MAAIFNSLMTQKLGYTKYVAQGGDFGSSLVHWLAELYPQNLMGLHVNLMAPPNDLRVYPYLVRVFFYSLESHVLLLK